MAPKAKLSSLPSLPGMDSDGDDDDEVTDAEMAKVLKEVLVDDKPPPKPPKPPAPKPAPAAPVPPPAVGPPIPADSVGRAVDSRVQELQAAAVLANRAGRRDEALHWLRRSKELPEQVRALLDGDFPSPSTHPWQPAPPNDGGGASPSAPAPTQSE